MSGDDNKDVMLPRLQAQNYPGQDALLSFRTPGPNFPDTPTKMPQSPLDLTPSEQISPLGLPSSMNGILPLSGQTSSLTISLGCPLAPSSTTSPSPLPLSCTGITCPHQLPVSLLPGCAPPNQQPHYHKHKSNHSWPLPGWLTDSRKRSKFLAIIQGIPRPQPAAVVYWF